MARFLKQRHLKKGLPPGSLVYIADEKSDQVKITVVNYSPEVYEERVVTHLEECIDDALSKKMITWVDVEGLSDAALMEDMGKRFGIHRLWLEDVLNTDHRPKIDELNDLVFVVLKAVEDFSTRKKVFFEQVSIFLGDDFVLSFQEYPKNIFESVKNNLKKEKGRIRQSGPDYLFYALIDSIVDGYFDAIEKLGQKIEGAEGLISKNVDPKTPQHLLELKNEILYLSKSAQPIRDALSKICRSTAKEIHPETIEYFKDALEHAVQVVDTIESYKQMLSSLNDFYQSRINHRMNEIVKILTVFSTIFTPLTFIVGVYGMNFENMPELKSEYGYPILWLVMILVVVTMALFIRRRKWF